MFNFQLINNYYYTSYIYFNFAILKLQMEKKLFTRLENQISSQASIIVYPILENILQKSQSEFYRKQLQISNNKQIAKQMMSKEFDSFQQAQIYHPLTSIIRQDTALNKRIFEGTRPFSAKIYLAQKKKKSKSKRTSFYKSYSNSNSQRSSLKNIQRQTKQSKINYLIKTTSDKFHPICIDSFTHDPTEDDFINLLRQKKAEERNLNKIKQNFLKETKQQIERYPKMQKKYLQIMGNKSLIYNKNCEIVQIPNTNDKGLKKMTLSRVNMKAENTKRSSAKLDTQILVEYKNQDFQIQPKQIKVPFEIEINSKLLFNTSQHCQYKQV